MVGNEEVDDGWMDGWIDECKRKKGKEEEARFLCSVLWCCALPWPVCARGLSCAGVKER